MKRQIVIGRRARIRSSPDAVADHPARSWRGRLWTLVHGLLPVGRGLSAEDWRRRHRWIVSAVMAQAALVPLVALAVGKGLAHGAVDALPAALLALVAWRQQHVRRLAEAAATLGLFVSAAVWVHLSGGLIETHFLFLIFLSVISLYQTWPPFLLAIGFVVVHHGLGGALAPHDVYNHPAAWQHPWRWAAIHGAFVALGSIVNLIVWRHAEHQALYDSLTGLTNQALFQDRLEHAVAGADRTERPPAVIFVDLDGFKAVNDTLGHAAGDEVLKQVAARLSQAARAADTVARLAGDEFAVLLGGVNGPLQALAAGERIAAALRPPLAIEGREISMQASVGVAVHCPGDSAGSVLKKADLAMYTAKRESRGGCRLFVTDMETAGPERLQLESDLQGAADRGELTLHYEPIVDLMSNELLGFEALIRWLHPTRGLLPPSRVLPISEESGLIQSVGHWALREAVGQAAAWRRAYPDREFSMAVNVSARQLHRSSFVSDVEAALRASGLDAGILMLEVTDSAFIETDVLAERLKHLKQLGVRIALDDFGIGYSSLGCLRSLPFDVVKIDRSFTSRVLEEREGELLSDVILRLARLLKLETVVEGVERPEQAEALSAMGCRAAQGSLFARPLPAEGAEHLLSRAAAGHAVVASPARTGPRRRQGAPASAASAAAHSWIHT